MQCWSYFWPWRVFKIISSGFYCFWAKTEYNFKGNSFQLLYSQSLMPTLLENEFYYWVYSQTYVKRPPLGPKIVAVWKRGLIKVRFRLVVDVSNWPFLTSGRCSEVVVQTGLIVFKIKIVDSFKILKLILIWFPSSFCKTFIEFVSKN